MLRLPEMPQPRLLQQQSGQQQGDKQSAPLSVASRLSNRPGTKQQMKVDENAVKSSEDSRQGYFSAASERQPRRSSLSHDRRFSIDSDRIVCKKVRIIATDVTYYPACLLKASVQAD